MENFYYSGWPEQPNWVQYHNPALHEDVPSGLTPRCVLPPNGTTFQSCGFPSWSASTEEGRRSSSASESHCQAEKRRRDRINGHLTTLRKLIPGSEKMDKAGLLRSVVEQVKNLKRRAAEVAKVLAILPTEVDEVTVECSSDNHQDIGSSSSTSKESLFIKASMCCDDRPELFSELNHALHGLKLRTVRAEMVSIGGRNKSILVICVKDDDHDGADVDKVKQSLKGVLSRIVLSSAPPGYRISSKRQRFFLPSNFPQ